VVGPFGLHHTSKDAENYGEEDQPLRWAKKAAKLHLPGQIQRLL
jgi:hypothetical protein